MKKSVCICLLTLAACGSQSDAPAGDAGSESAVEARAATIRDAAEADINRQMSEIEAAANAEQAALPADNTATPKPPAR